MIEEQLSLFDLLPKTTEYHRILPECAPDIGEYVQSHGANICHIMRPAYIGKKVIYDCSTRSHKWLRCGILERYFLCEGKWRSVIFDGDRQRVLLDHYPGVEIFEPLPWDAYPRRRGYG